MPSWSAAFLRSAVPLFDQRLIWSTSGSEFREYSLHVALDDNFPTLHVNQLWQARIP